MRKTGSDSGESESRWSRMVDTVLCIKPVVAQKTLVRPGSTLSTVFSICEAGTARGDPSFGLDNEVGVAD